MIHVSCCCLLAAGILFDFEWKKVLVLDKCLTNVPYAVRFAFAKTCVRVFHDMKMIVVDVSARN